MKKIFSILLLLSIVLLSSCNYVSKEYGNDAIIAPDESEMPSSILSADMNLEGTKWDFAEYDAILDFNDGRYHLNAGCNGIGGTYSIDEFKAKFESGISTMMFCGDDVMKTESELSQFVTTITKITITDSELILISDLKTIKLNKALNAELIGTKWSLSSILDNNGLVSDRSFENSVIEFNDEGKLYGVAICNNIMGNYELYGNKINIPNLGMTKMMCPTDGTSEFIITETLGNIDLYEIVRDEMTLKSSDGKYKVIYNLIK